MKIAKSIKSKYKFKKRNKKRKPQGILHVSMTLNNVLFTFSSFNKKKKSIKLNFG